MNKTLLFTAILFVGSIAHAQEQDDPGNSSYLLAEIETGAIAALQSFKNMSALYKTAKNKTNKSLALSDINRFDEEWQEFADNLKSLMNSLEEYANLPDHESTFAEETEAINDGIKFNRGVSRSWTNMKNAINDQADEEELHSSVKTAALKLMRAAVSINSVAAREGKSPTFTQALYALSRVNQ